MSLRSEIIRVFNELTANSKKISELPAAGALTGSELVEGVQSGANVKMTAQDIADLGGGGGGGTWGSITGTLSDQTDLNTALGNRQPIDSDLTDIAGLSPSNDDFIQRKAGEWTNRTIAQVKTDLSLSGTNTGDQTSVSGNAGSATVLATARNIDGQSFNGSADITVIAPGTHAATGKTTPVDDDELPLVDSEASNVLKKLTWANLKATLKTYFDSLYPAIAGSKVIQLACSDETTALTTGTAKITFRMPYAMTVTAVRAALVTSQTSGSIFTVDINEAGTTILSTKLTIDNTEKTSTTAATAPVISDTSLADDAEITVDIDQIGDGTAKGLKVTLIGY